MKKLIIITTSSLFILLALVVALVTKNSNNTSLTSSKSKTIADTNTQDSKTIANAKIITDKKIASAKVIASAKIISDAKIVADAKIISDKRIADKKIADAKIIADKKVSDAKGQSNSSEYKRYYNQAYDFTLLYPTFLTDKEGSATGGSVTYFNNDKTVNLLIGASINSDNITVDSDYNSGIANTENVVDSTQSDNWFVIESTYGDTTSYTKEIVGVGSIVAFTFTCPISEKDKYAKDIAKLKETFIAPSVDVSR